ncbi:MAG: protein kinase [Polyangiales bacterium]
MNRRLPPLESLIAGKYRIDAMLGQGGMGSVYAATNILTGKRVALKCMNPGSASNPDASSRFLREAKASARIRHQNVVDVYDVISTDDVLYLIMELLDGESLSDLLERETVPLPHMLRYLSGAIRGVLAAHRQGVIHRDVKPANIFLAREGVDGQIIPKVLDFGISKIQDPHELALTAPGAALGSVLYMSTEQLAGAADVDERADIYAFGVILYQALTGQLPYYADTVVALALRVMTEHATPVNALRPDVPAKLAHLVEWAMAKEAKDRLPDLDILLRELEPFCNEDKYKLQLTRTIDRKSFPRSRRSGSRPGTSSPETGRPDTIQLSSVTAFVAHDAASTTRGGNKTRPWLTPLLMLVALAGIGLGGWWLRQHDGATQTTASHGLPAEAPPPPAATVPSPLVTAPTQPVVKEPPQQRPADPVSVPIRPPPPPANDAARFQQRVAVNDARPPSPPPAPSGPTSPAANAVSTKPPTAAKRPGCSPNYYFDPQGQKHFKHECF